MTCESRNINRININPIKSVYYGFNELLLNLRKVIVFFLFEKGCMKKIFNLLI